MTKKQAKAWKEAWALALADGRVVKFGDLTMTSYSTRDCAEHAVTEAIEAGRPAHIVRIP